MTMVGSTSIYGPRTASCTSALILVQALWFAGAHAAQTPGQAPRPPLYTLKLSNETTLSVNKATITYGTTVRAQGRDPELLPPANAARVGATGVAPGGVNSDDGNLNYDKNSHVSTALKGIIDLELKHGKTFGVFVRARAWDDHAQRRDAVPHGNLPNNYAANTPLGDGGFSKYGQFSGARLMDAYIYGSVNVGEQPLSVKVGSQAIDWGRQETTLLGGLEQINAIDYTARYRAGALPEEGYIPVPAIFARWQASKTTAVEAFYLLRFHENENVGCGTFFALADYVTEGCDKVLAQPVTVTDPAAVAGGVFARRAPDGMPPDNGQYGIGITHLAENLGLFGVYFANYHSRRFSPSAIKSTRPLGALPLIPADPGPNVRYFMEYPEDVRMFGVNFKTQLPDKTGIYAEYTYRPNQVILLNSTDLFNAFASNAAPTLLRADATATPPGGVYQGYDRRKLSQVVVGASKPLGRVVGGALVISGEAGLKYIHDLPDVNVRRYGRSELYGLGPVNGFCLPPANPKQCSSDGFVSASSWGYRVKLATRYADIIDGVALAPSISFAHDVRGWSHDIIFIEGRKAATLALRAELGKMLFAEASWTPIWGGDYNFVKDRDYYSLVAGVQF